MCTAECIETRFRSNRTDFVKLEERIKLSKSGSDGKSIQLTPIQRWKLNRYKFVAPYVVKRKQLRSAELGKVSICNNTDEIHSFPQHPYPFFSLPFFC